MADRLTVTLFMIRRIGTETMWLFINAFITHLTAETWQLRFGLEQCSGQRARDIVRSGTLRILPAGDPSALRTALLS